MNIVKIKAVSSEKPFFLAGEYISMGKCDLFKYEFEIFHFRSVAVVENEDVLFFFSINDI